MSIPQPPPGPRSNLERLDTEGFRRRLAKLADPSTGPGALTPAVVKDLASRFCSTLAHLFSDDLDRLTLWVRIDSGLSSALAKSGDDIDRFASECLEYIKADAGRVAACEPLAAVLGTLAASRPEDRQAFLRYFRVHRYPALIHGRQRWQQVMSKEIEL